MTTPVKTFWQPVPKWETGPTAPVGKDLDTSLGFGSTVRTSNTSQCPFLVKVNDVVYSSLKRASLALGISSATIIGRVANPNFPRYEQIPNPEWNGFCAYGPERLSYHQYYVEGTYFVSMRDITLLHGISSTTIIKRLKSEEFPEWRRL